jgi:DNA-binding NarL/FixJ family response regulator
VSITCTVYDDRRRARDLIGRMVAAVPDVHRVVAAVSVEELIRRLTGEHGQVAVIGRQRSAPGEPDAVRRVLAVRPGTPVVAVGPRDDVSAVRAAVTAGARAFLRWDASPDVISTLLHSALGAGPRTPGCAPLGRAPGTLSRVVTDPDVQVDLGISRREMQVLGAMCEGMSNAAIGRELYLSSNTVKSLARRLFGKLGVHERAHAVAEAHRVGLFASPEV